MSVIVGIDPSLTSTGIAILHDGRPHRITRCCSEKDGTSHAHRNRRIRTLTVTVAKTITKHCNQTQPDLIVIEGLLEHGPMLPSAIDRHALWHFYYAEFDIRKIPIVVVNPTTLKTWITGKGNASKADVINTVNDWWPDLNITNDDQADATGLALLGAFKQGHPMPFELKPRHYAAIEKITWPEVDT